MDKIDDNLNATTGLLDLITSVNGSLALAKNEGKNITRYVSGFGIRASVRP